MKQVAKVVVVAPEGRYLLLYRSNHPMFSDDPDLPGGTIEDGETMDQAAVREVEEEIGVSVSVTDIQQLYFGDDYSYHGTIYALYIVHVAAQPAVTLSWEHSSYEWLDRDTFIEKSLQANDSYMHMVGEVVGSDEQ